MSERLEFELTVPRNNLDSALDTASKKSGNLQSAINTALGVFAGGAALKGLELLGDGIRKTVDFAEESIQAYSEQEDALNRLRQALRASGDESEASLSDLSAYASELQRTTKYGDETVLSQLAVAKSFGASNDEAKKLVLAAANLSATFGGSLEDNVKKLGKTFSGNAGELRELIPELANLTKEQLAAGEAAFFVNQRFSGAAAAELETYSGRVVALKNAFSDMQEEVGALIVNSSAVQESQSILTTIFQDITTAISDWRIEMERQNGTLKENETSVDQLKRKYEDLQENLMEVQETAVNPTMWETLSGQVAYAKNNISDLAAEVDNARIAYLTAKDEFEKDKPSGDEGGNPKRGVPQDVLDARQKLNDEILFLDQQLVLEQNNLDQERINQQIENDLLRQQAEIQRMTDFALTKAELEFQLREEELLRITEGEDEKLALKKLYAEKELALTKIRNDGIIKQAGAVRDAEKKAAQERIALQQAAASTITGIIGSAANLSVLLTKEGSKEQFYIQKAAALAQAIVATNLAIAMANTVPPPGNIPAIAAAKANGAIAISGIVASTIKGFQEGGIIGGEGQGASNGRDNTLFKGRDGEMVLTANDQKMLLDGIRAGSLGGGDIVVQIDGDTIFKIVRNKVKQGYKLQ